MVTSANMADRACFRKNVHQKCVVVFFKQSKSGFYFDWNWPADHEYENIQLIGCVIFGKTGRKAKIAMWAKRVQADQRPVRGATGTSVGRKLLLFRRFVFGMTSWRPFCTFSPGHSHGRNFALIFFRIADKVESCLPVFVIENQLDRLATSANMADRVF